MSAPPSTPSTFDQLKSAEQSELMDAIDKLRNHGLNNELDLPQLVVCGSQSSGKSSVLEAIAQVTFPAGEGTKTRFASELALRHAKYEHRKVVIRAAVGTPAAEIDYLNEFQPDFTKAEDFPNILDQAAAHLQKVQGGRTFSKHLLRVELSGPDKPHLTLVDLPGLIATAKDVQDVEHVQTIVEPYLKERRSIILAVMPAIDDHDNHPVFRLVRNHDPDGTRTLGILTKPDRLERGSEKEGMAVNMVLGHSMSHHSSPLGWHVLRNRDHANRDATHQDRDRLEEEFFSDPDSLWGDLPKNRRGVASLRLRLRDLLFGVISQSLPTLKNEIQDKVKACQVELELLGDARPEKIQQLRFLDSITKRLGTLIDQAVKAECDDSFFGASDTREGQQKRLRTQIESIGDAFMAKMEVSELYCVADNKSWCQRHRQAIKDGEVTFDPRAGRTSCIPEAAMLRAIEKHMAANRPKLLVGEYSTVVITSVFRILCTRWHTIADNYVEDCVRASEQFMLLALRSVTDSSTQQKIWKQVMRQRFQACRDQVKQKVSELLTPFEGSVAFTRNRAYAIAKNIRDGAQKAMDSQLTTAQCILNRVLAYYQVSLCTFIDNVIALAVENCIVQPLHTFFNSTTVLELNEVQIATIASEDENITSRRDAALGKLEVLQEVLEVCKIYSGNDEPQLSDMGYCPDERQENHSVPDKSFHTVASEPGHKQSVPSLFSFGRDKSPLGGRPDPVRIFTPPKTPESVGKGRQAATAPRFIGFVPENDAATDSDEHL